MIKQKLLNALRAERILIQGDIYGPKYCVDFSFNSRGILRVSVQGVKSLGDHFACLCRGFKFHEVKKIVIFQKEDRNTFTLLIIFIVKSLQKRAKYVAQIYCYDPHSAGINLQSPQSDSTPWTLTL